MDSDHHSNQYQAERGKRDNTAGWLCVLTPGKSSWPGEAGNPKVLTLNNELEITQTKEKKSATLSGKEYRRWVITLHRKRKETPIKRLEDAVHSLNWPSGETQLLDRGKKHPKDTHQIAGEDILFSNSDGPDAQTD